jgi:molybdopterin synthase catalytic subunit
VVAALASTFVREPAAGHDWLALTAEELPIGAAYEWVVRPDCGGVVLFSGTVRDHAEGRSGVTSLTYEAYEEHVVGRLERIAEELRRRWPGVGRVVLWHRTGELALTESSVVVAVSAPHRPEAFEAARFGIDTLKATAPIWKKETWGADDAGWAVGAQGIRDVGEPTADDGPDRAQVP